MDEANRANGSTYEQQLTRLENSKKKNEVRICVTVRHSGWDWVVGPIPHRLPTAHRLKIGARVTRIVKREWSVVFKPS